MDENTIMTILVWSVIGLFALALVWNFILRWKRGHLGRREDNGPSYIDPGPYGGDYGAGV